MDTPAADAAQSPYTGVLREMRQNGHRLKDPSFVLLRMANAGSAPIGPGDHLTPDDDPCGIRVTFQDRHVAGLVVTELGQTDPIDSFIREHEAVPGFGFDNNAGTHAGVIRLPKVKLPQGAAYKVLVTLERRTGDTGRGHFPKPEFRGAVGGHRRPFDPLITFGQLKVARTESHVFASQPAWTGIGLLAPAVVAQSKYPYWQTEFAYTYGDPPAGSIAAAFLTYLTEQGGRDILREYGDRLCSEVENPRVCEPA